MGFISSEDSRLFIINLRLLFITNKWINFCNFITNFPIFRLYFQISCKAFESFRELSSFFIKNSQIIMCYFIFWMNLQDALVVFNRLFQFSILMKNLRQTFQRQIMLRVNSKSHFIVIFCLFKVFSVFVSSCKVVEIVGIMTVDLNCFIVILYCFFIIFHRIIDNSQTIVVLTELRINLNTFFKIFYGFYWIFVKIEISKIIVSVCIVRKKLDSFQEILQTLLLIS